VRRPTPEVSEGDVAAPREFGPVTREDIVRYAGASGDFNQIHYDDEVAHAAGFDATFTMGMLQAGYLGTFATDWLGPEALRSFEVRFVDQVWLGDVLTCSGRVTAVHTEPGASGVVTTTEVSLLCEAQDGRQILTGRARFERPMTG
jgi:acyl dehydratase